MNSFNEMFPLARMFPLAVMHIVLQADASPTWYLMLALGGEGFS